MRAPKPLVISEPGSGLSNGSWLTSRRMVMKRSISPVTSATLARKVSGSASASSGTNGPPTSVSLSRWLGGRLLAERGENGGRGCGVRSRMRWAMSST